MQVSRISIRERYDAGCANTGSHTLIINDNNAHTDILQCRVRMLCVISVLDLNDHMAE